MGIFNRKPAQQTPISGENALVQTDPISEFDGFLDAVVPQVDEYRASWLKFGQVITSVAEDERIQGIALGAVMKFETISEDVIARSGQVVSSNRLEPEEVVDRYFSVFPMFYAAHIKHATQGLNIRRVLRSGRMFLTGDELADEIGSSISVSLFKTTLQTSDAHLSALGNQEAVIAEFSGMASKNIEVVLSAKRPAVKDDDDTDGVKRVQTYRDVRDIFAADLMQGDESKGLRALITSIDGNEDVFLHPFAQQAEGLGEESPLGKIGRTALLTARMTDSDITFVDAAVMLRPHWGEIDPAIEREFDSYMRSQARAAERKIVETAGLKSLNETRRGLRFPVSERDYNATRSAYGRLINTNTARNRLAALKAANTLVSDEASEQLVSGGREPASVKLFKAGINGEGHAVDCEDEAVDDMIHDYAGTNDELFEDVIAMVEVIAADPMSEASYPVKSAKAVKMDNRSRRLRVYNPQRHSVSLKSGKSGKRTRVLYFYNPDTDGDGPGEVIIHSVLHHDDYDVKFGKSR